MTQASKKTVKLAYKKTVKPAPLNCSHHVAKFEITQAFKKTDPGDEVAQATKNTVKLPSLDCSNHVVKAEVTQSFKNNDR